MRVLLVSGVGSAESTVEATASAISSARRGVKTRLLLAPAADDTAVGDRLGRAGLDEPALITGPVRCAPDGSPTSAPVSGPTSAPAPEPAPGRAGGVSWPPGAAALLAALAEQWRIDAVPLTLTAAVPGATELTWLFDLLDSVERAGADLLVADLGQAPAAARLLAVPAGLRAVLDRLLPVGRRVERALELPADPAGELADLLRPRLCAVLAVLHDAGTTVRLVHRADAAQRARCWAPRLAAHGCRVEIVPVPGVGGAGGPDPLRDPMTGRALTVAPAGSGYLLSLALPYATRTALELERLDDDLLVDASGGRVPAAVVGLAPVLRRCRVVGAALDHAGCAEAVLRVRFSPDPDLWPQHGAGE